MQILIMGSGAVGGYFGGVLHRAGLDVTFVARGDHLDAIQTRGLQISSVAMGDFVVHPRVIDFLDGSWAADLVLYCVKSYDNDSAIDVMKPAVAENTTILTLQNGIGSSDKLSDAFGCDKVLQGVTYVDATRESPGVVCEVGGPVDIVFGEEDGSQTPRALAIRNVLAVDGIDVVLSPNVIKEAWTKLVYICALSGMTCIVRSPFEQVVETPETLGLVQGVLSEVDAVARAKGVDIDDDIVGKTMARFQGADRTATSSMFTDLQRGRPLEVGVLNGAVSRMGMEVGVDTPLNDFIFACLSVSDRQARLAVSAKVQEKNLS